MKIGMYENVANFGDVLNKYLWTPYFAEFLDRDDGILMMGIGTLLGHSKPHARQVIVCGSGSGYGGDFSQMKNEQWKIFFVRGPKTAALLDLPNDLAVTDPAILTPEVFPAGPKTGKTIFVPHWETSQNPLWKSACEKAGIEYIDPLGDIAGIMSAISGAKLVIAEAMHAAIIADAYRVPWVSVATSSRINGFKWQDWASSLDMNHSFRHFSALGLSNKIFNLSTGRADIFKTKPANNENSMTPAQRRTGTMGMARSVYKKVIPKSWQGGKDIEFLSDVAITIDKSLNVILKSGVYDRFYEKTVRDLTSAASQGGTMSDDAVYQRQKTRIHEKLQEVRTYLSRYQA